MEYKTYSDIKKEVQRALDLQAESFITDPELLEYCNNAINTAESEIHGIYEDYFLKSSTIDLTSGEKHYSLPSDIFANKIRDLVYNDGSTIYSVKRLTSIDKFEQAENYDIYDPDAYYSYFIVNRGSADNFKPKIRLVPASSETKAGVLKIFYLRNANKVALDTDVVDIPEFYSFIVQFMKVECYKKEGHPNLGLAMNSLERERRMMIDTLSNMVPDGENQMEMDLTFYEEMH